MDPVFQWHGLHVGKINTKKTKTQTNLSNSPIPSHRVSTQPTQPQAVTHIPEIKVNDDWVVMQRDRTPYQFRHIHKIQRSVPSSNPFPPLLLFHPNQQAHLPAMAYPELLPHGVVVKGSDGSRIHIIAGIYSWITSILICVVKIRRKK